MLTERTYALVLIVAIAMTVLTVIWFLEQADQHSYAQATFIPPSYIKVMSNRVEVPDKFILMTWPANSDSYGYYDMRKRSQLSESRLRFGFGLMKALEGQMRRCSGGTIDSFLINCVSVSMGADSVSEANVDSGYWHMLSNDEVDDDSRWYSAALVLTNKQILWFEGNSADCASFAQPITDAVNVDVNWFCRRP